MSVSLALALLQSGTASSAVDFLIRGQARNKAERARAFVTRLSTRQSGDLPMARFSEEVCVTSLGLDAASGQMIVDEVSAVARMAGLRTGQTGCSPNLLVAFVADGQSTALRLARAGAGAMRSQSLAAVKRIIGEAGQARAWIEVEPRGRDGERPIYSPDQPTMIRGRSLSRLSSPVRMEIVSATVLIDRDAMQGRPLTQAAQYAAMRALTGAQGGGAAAGESILSAFTSSDDVGAPKTLTANDRGYLRGLYAGRGDIAGNLKFSSLVSYVLDERSSLPAGDRAR